MGIPLKNPSVPPGATIDSQSPEGWLGVQGITKDAKDAASSSTCSTEHIRSQGQAPTSFGSPLLPSQDDTRIQLRRNSGIKLKVSGKAEKG